MNRKKTASPSAPKLFQSIREVSGVLEVKPHVLRYWETQFPMLRPRKNRAGNRMYRPEEIELLERIKDLLYARRFTIEGARRLLSEEKKPRTAKTAVAVTASPAGDADGSRVSALAHAAVEAAREAELERERLARALRLAETSLGAVARRDEMRTAALAAVRQELTALARELRGEEATAPAVAAETPVEERVTVLSNNGAAEPGPAMADEHEVADAAGRLPVPVGA